MNSHRLVVVSRRYVSVGLDEIDSATTFAAVAAGVLAPLREWPTVGASLWIARAAQVVLPLLASTNWLKERSWIERAARTPPPVTEYPTFRSPAIFQRAQIARGELFGSLQPPALARCH